MPAKPSKLIQPKEALFLGQITLPIIPVCDHYAGNSKLISKSLALQSRLGPVFDITMDLEDGAAAQAGTDLAEVFVELLNSPENKIKQSGVRLPDYHTPNWKKHLDIILSGSGKIISHLVLPKITSAKGLAQAMKHIERRASHYGLKRLPPVHVLIETQQAVLEIWEIAGISGLRGLDFGAMDFVSDHAGAISDRAFVSPGQFEHRLMARAKTELVAAALANGLVPVHNVTPEYGNPDRAYADALRAKKEFGFMRMWSIHPSQIEPIIRAMNPAEDEIETAAQIIIKAAEADWAPISFGSRLHDRASYRYYWQILERAKKSGLALPEKIRSEFFK